MLPANIATAAMAAKAKFPRYSSSAAKALPQKRLRSFQWRTVTA